MLPDYFLPSLALLLPISLAFKHPSAVDKTENDLRAIPTQAPKEWVHPGVFVQRTQLDFVAEKIAAGAEPWSEAYDSMMKYNYSSPTRTAEPFTVVECGPTSTPNVGCYEEREDSMAAYINALAWWVTKDRQYADKAIHYLDSWSSTIQGHENSNAPLQAAWSAANWVRAGEILRSACAGWSAKGIEAFSDMLRRAYIPIIEEGDTKNNGNWDLVMMEAAIGAAVFLEDATLYEKSMDLFAQRVPAYVYLTSDGEYPVPGRGIDNTTDAIVKFWYNQETYPVSGISQETCRDFAHFSYGIASMAHVAETSRIQGVDLWETDLGVRVEAALELHTPFITGDKEIPEWLCNGEITRTMNPMLEPAYNALAYRMSHDMPFTQKLLLQQRPAEIGEPNPLFVGFETVTNAEVST